MKSLWVQESIQANREKTAETTTRPLTETPALEKELRAPLLLLLFWVSLAVVKAAVCEMPEGVVPSVATVSDGAFSASRIF